MIVLVMGVAGVGKTTIGEALARALGARFIDADDYHQPENVAKMKAGVPLGDEDRWPWLKRLNEELRKERRAVLACSALKEIYRRRCSTASSRRSSRRPTPLQWMSPRRCTTASRRLSSGSNQ